MNKYLLNPDRVTIIDIYIYIYIYIKTVSFFVLFERKTNEEFDWCSLFILLKSEAFAGEALVFGDISFSKI